MNFKKAVGVFNYPDQFCFHHPATKQDYVNAHALLEKALVYFHKRRKRLKIHIIESDPFTRDLLVYEIGNFLVTRRELLDGLSENSSSPHQELVRKSQEIEKLLITTFDGLKKLGISKELQSKIRREFESKTYQAHWLKIGKLAKSAALKVWRGGVGSAAIAMSANKVDDLPQKVLAIQLKALAPTLAGQKQGGDDFMVDIYKLCHHYPNSLNWSEQVNTESWPDSFRNATRRGRISEYETEQTLLDMAVNYQRVFNRFKGHKPKKIKSLELLIKRFLI